MYWTLCLRAQKTIKKSKESIDGGRRQEDILYNVSIRGGNNFIRFKFRHLAIFSRFSTKISYQVALKLLVLSPKLHTRLLFLVEHQNATSSVLNKKHCQII